MGVVPTRPVVYEVLEDMAITVAMSLLETPVPFCAFNGGADVFVDIGNKSLGLHALMKFVGASSEQARPPSYFAALAAHAMPHSRAGWPAGRSPALVSHACAAAAARIRPMCLLHEPLWERRHPLSAGRCGRQTLA